ncbi:MAG: nucleotidyltransferase domain-containing protein [Eubacteriales bacterium]|nr:nucleotidyltransferase domain-containing protein [Eubacteriales bacterium]
MTADEVIQEVAERCRNFHATRVILYGSRAKGTAMERSDIDIAVSGVRDFEQLEEQIEDLPTLYSVDLLNMDTCRNELLMEDIRQYGREI